MFCSISYLHGTLLLISQWFHGIFSSRWAENSCLLLFLVYCYTLPHVPFYLSFAQCSFANHFLFTFQIVLSLIKIIDWLRWIYIIYRKLSTGMHGEQYFCWKYNKASKHPTIICTQFKNPKGRVIATPLEFLDIPMGQKYPSTLNHKAASLMINKTKVLPCLLYGFCRIFILFYHHFIPHTPPPPSPQSF